MTDQKILQYGGVAIGLTLLGLAIGGYVGAFVGALLAIVIVRLDLKRKREVK